MMEDLSSERTPAIRERFSVSNDDYESLAEGLEIQHHSHRIPADFAERQIIDVVDQETGGRLPAEVVKIVRINGEGFITLRKADLG